MRFLTLAFAAAFALSFLTVSAAPGDALALPTMEESTETVALCVIGDAYNTHPAKEPCRGIVCTGYDQWGWTTCYPEELCETARCETYYDELCSIVECPATAPMESTDQMAICVIGDVYNTGGSPCEGVLCTGWNQWGWQTCYPDLGCWPQCAATDDLATTASTGMVGMAGVCVSGVYNNMGHPDDCGGVACYGYNSQTGWQTCVPPRCSVSCPIRA